VSRTIPLTKGYVTVVDDEDYERLSEQSWWALVAPNDRVYAVRSASRVERMVGLPRNVYMHREILGVVMNSSQDVDHHNHDGLDNQRANLRLCSRSNNHANRRKIRGVSRYKGVQWDKSRGQWLAKIKVNRRHQNLGRFSNEADAARAYDRAASEQWGEFACLNFPRGT